MKIKKGDHVIVRSGKDKGKAGTVLATFSKSEKVIVEGVNKATHHEKAKRRGSVGQIIVREMPMHVSKVGLKDAKTGKPSRVGYTFEGEGEKRKKVRVTRKSGEKA